MLWENPNSRWTKQSLSRYLEAGEEVRVAAAAFSGILSHPLIVSGPYMLGSTFWDLALTGRRIIAVERPLVPIFTRNREVLSFPLDGSVEIEVTPLWGVNGILRVATPERRHRFKLIWTFSSAHEFVKALRQTIGSASS